MKKTVMFLMGILLLLTAGSSAVFAESDSAPQLVPDFFDDFESYEAGNWIEETPGFAGKWSNNVLDEDEGLQVDAHLKQRAKIVYEEGSAGNKVLYLSNMTGGNSFFYIAPKSDNVWYTGCHNLNITLSVEKDKSCIVSHAYRNMPGTSDILLKEQNNEGYTVSYQTFTSETKRYEGDWFDVRYEVEDSSFKLYIDDFLLVDLNYPSRLVSDFGYVSLNGCTTMAYFDDFKIENRDTEAPPVLEPEDPSEPSDPSGDGDHAGEENNPPVEEKGCKKGASLPLLFLGAVFCCWKRAIR